METKEKKTEEKVFNFYLITAAAGAVAVLGVGLVLLIMLLKRKKAKKAALNVADLAADNNESAGETTYKSTLDNTVFALSARMSFFLSTKPAIINANIESICLSVSMNISIISSC